MIQNKARPRGRPRSFDERDALEKATQVFWSKGYDGVTIDDLVAGMGVGRPSLYALGKRGQGPGCLTGRGPDEDRPTKAGGNESGSDSRCQLESRPPCFLKI